MLSFGPEVRQQFPLPAIAHRPGRNDRPSEDLKLPVRASLDLPVTEENYHHHKAYLYGFALYRAGYYWEAHEIWEPVWMRCAPNSIERLVLQAIIQLANAALKASQGNAKASARLQAIALGLLREIRGRKSGAEIECRLLGVDIVDLQSQLT